MDFKKYIVALFLVLSFFGTTFVYSNFYKTDVISSPNIYTKALYQNEDILSKTYVSYDASVDISKYKIIGKCDASSKFEKIIWEKTYLFSLELTWEECTDWVFFLQDDLWQRIVNTGIRFQIKSYFSLFHQFSDIDMKSLEKAYFQLEKFEKKLQKFKKISSSDSKESFRKYFQYHEVVLQKNIVWEMIEQRKEKYLIPVAGHLLPTRETKLPNSGRPYRADYTYGIHEGWDIDAELWEKILSIDDGVIVRVVNDFVFEDLDHLIKKETLSHNERTTNLDTLRWNQVWLKTSKWDMVFYSHLDSVNENIVAWMRVKKWDILGTVGISGVPDKNYTDYHLHFELRKNPYDLQYAWKYTFQDYMNWDWYFKGKSAQYIQQNQYTIFQK